MALNGPQPLDDDDLDAVDRQVAVQAAFLDRFRSEVETRTPPELAVATAPPDPDAMTSAQFVARTEQYAGVSWGNAINTRRERVRRLRQFTQERRVHAKPMGEHDACVTCEGESAKGWVPIGTLLPIGDSECLGIKCDCYYEFRNPGEAA